MTIWIFQNIGNRKSIIWKLSQNIMPFFQQGNFQLWMYCFDCSWFFYVLKLMPFYISILLSWQEFIFRQRLACLANLASSVGKSLGSGLERQRSLERQYYISLVHFWILSSCHCLQNKHVYQQPILHDITIVIFLF